jgi:protein-S-isoprenylcysteine O-methyltransferase Ste14
VQALERSNARPSRLTLTVGNFVFRYRDALGPVLLLFMVAFTRPRPFLHSARWDAYLSVAGLVVVLAGQALRVLVIGLAYIKRGGRNRRIAADQLVCEGMFAHCRHPLYVGNFLMVSGLLLLWNAPWAYATVIPTMAVALFSMALAEEAFLAKKFGAQYDDYRARVNRFVPDFRGFRKTLSGFSFNWKQVVRKEYGTTFAWSSTALFLITTKRLHWWGSDGARDTMRWTVPLWAAALALYSLARWAKKTGRLGRDG